MSMKILTLFRQTGWNVHNDKITVEKCGIGLPSGFGIKAKQNRRDATLTE
ncbi:hypothetical protein GCM10027291_43800 [Telluribacter humicola]